MTSRNFADPDEIAAILDMKRIAVVGLSSNPSRPSYEVARYMQAHGYTIIPVNPAETEVLGEKSYEHVTQIPEAPEVVNIFRRSEFVEPIVSEAIYSGAKAIWMQLDVIDIDAAVRAREAGLLVVVDRCMKIEHSRRGK